MFKTEGFDGVMERLMEAAGQQNHPPPATELVIQGLPRISLDETNYSTSARERRLITTPNLHLR
jgi:hypothetical protein